MKKLGCWSGVTVVEAEGVVVVGDWKENGFWFGTSCGPPLPEEPNRLGVVLDGGSFF